MIQALNLRLNEELGSRLRLAVYGIRARVGGAATDSTPINYIVANIKDSVMQDPRVSSVSKMMLKGQGDSLGISFDVQSIRLNEVVPFKGGI